MSKDPLDELFGPLDGDDAEGDAPEIDSAAAAPTRAHNPFPEPAPRPAQATAAELFPNAAPDPVSTPASPAAPGTTRSRDELPTKPVPANRKKSGAALPWIIIGAVAVLLLIGAFIFVNTMTGSDDPEPVPTPEAPATEDPVPTPSETPSEEPTAEPEPTATEAPAVEVGETGTMEISYAGISVDFSYKLSNIQWFYQAGPPERVLIETGLMNSFPDSCAAMRSPVGQSPWGIEKDPAGGWSVVRPEGTCAEDPALYDEVWGLMQALADSAKPLGGGESGS